MCICRRLREVRLDFWKQVGRTQRSRFQNAGWVIGRSGKGTRDSITTRIGNGLDESSSWHLRCELDTTGTATMMTTTPEQ